MQLLHPLGLLLLGLIPVLLILHSLKPKPREVEVSTLFLWEEAVREMRGGGRIRSLLRDPLLLLQILTVVVAALALAEPVWTRSLPLQGDTVLVIDTSAGMQARSRRGIRMDEAKKEAGKLIEGLSSDGRMLILEAADRPRVLTPFSRDKKQLLRIVENLRPKDVSGDLEGALLLALSFLKAEKEDRVFLLTDGALAGVHPRLRHHQKIIPRVIGEEGRNVGITHFDCRPDPETENLYQGWLEIRNFHRHPVIIPLKVFAGPQILFRKTLGLQPGEKKPLLFPFLRPPGDTVQAVLEITDDLAVDDRAFYVLPAAAPLRVLLVSRGNFFLSHFLGAFPDLQVRRVSQISPLSWEKDAADYDLIILDSIVPPSTPPGHYLLLNSFPPSLGLKPQGLQKNPAVVGWDRGHPLFQHLDPSNWPIERAFRVQASSGWESLLESREGGLIYSYEKERRRALLINFDLLGSDLPRRVAFPVLMTNCLRWLQSHRHPERPRQVKAGEPYLIEPKPFSRVVNVTLPGGERIQLPVSGAPFPFRRTEKVGIYTVQEGPAETRFAVNLFSESESDLRMDPSLSTGRRPTEATPVEKVPGLAPLWFYVLPLALMSLVLECHLWLRRC